MTKAKTQLKTKTTANTATKPNIIFFFTDDQRFDTIHALGNSQIHTPNLDKLVEKGTAFTNAYIMGGSSGAVCMPSRAMLMTGRTLYHIEGEGQTISENHLLLGEHFKQQGYRTFGIGKWHNGRSSFARSFTGGGPVMFGGMADHWNVPVYNYDPEGKYHTRLPYCPEPLKSNRLEWRDGDHIVAGRHSSELFGDAAADIISKYNDEEHPFFIYIAFTAPHDPRTMPQEYLDMYNAESIELAPNIMGAHPFDNGHLKGRDERLEDWPRTPEALRRHTAEYYAMITHVDAQIGKVLTALERAGRAENTIIVFAGDNGLALGRHGLMGKQNLYEHSIHVPFIMCGPGIPQGERRSALCYLLDIYPTLCQLCDLPVPETVEGKSLVPVLHVGRDNDSLTSMRDSMFYAFTNLMRAVRDERWKLIEYVVRGCRTTQLFDLQNDPDELINLAQDPSGREHVGRLRHLLFCYRDELDTGEQGRQFWSGW
ncbi:MAG TPA: sulfatase-like hydrolase/transferase [Firmicutes bacterium]|nr:sulfatase-like hydrolase/transferase [Bacillota bacterium]